MTVKRLEQTDQPPPEQQSSPQESAPAPEKPRPALHPIRDKVESRANELMILKRVGHRLTTAQKNLLDFWFVDCQRFDPTEAQCAAKIRSAESVDSNLHWRR
jgi:hypothetical protein